MRYLADGSQMKRADQYTIHKAGIPSLKLMERAARACVEVMEEERFDLTKACIVCGSGNNGGDGFAIARLLLRKGYHARVCFVGDESHCTQETRQQIEWFQEIGGKICNEYIEDEYSIIIDAVFGVGLCRKITGKYADVLRKMNEAKAVKFAVDLPSGISADTGCVLGEAFQADLTVTFQLEKLGLVFYPGSEYAGWVHTADVGIYTEQLAEEYQMAYACDEEDYRAMLPIRKADSNKGTYGKLLVIAGSKGMSGAAYLNARAAYLAGAGLVRIYTPEENRMILQQQLPEAIITSYTDYQEEELLELLEWADVICIGSGIGTGEVSQKLVKKTLEGRKVPCLIDADGLNILAGHPEYLRECADPSGRTGCGLVLTPHMKEMSRLTGRSIEELKEDRMRILEGYTDRFGCTCVLKDSRTAAVSPQEGICVNQSGNASMAKAGAGDVLAGVIAGLMAQGLQSHSAAALGTYLHGRSGDLARAAKGSYSVMAGDLLTYLSEAFRSLEGEDPKGRPGIIVHKRRFRSGDAGPSPEHTSDALKIYSRVCARIDLDAIEYNMEMMKQNLEDGVQIISVIKSDGYGHGALQIARFLESKEYIWGYALAALDEAVVLRKGGITKPLLVLGCIFPEQWCEMIDEEIRMTVYTKDMAKRVSDLAVRIGKQAYIHIKVDTGMSRLGFPVCEESADHIRDIIQMPNLVVEGMYTHFAKADEAEKAFTRKQIEDYLWMKKALERRSVRIRYHHSSNSAGIIDVKEANMDLVRAGIATYGLYPSEEVKKGNVPLRPAMELLSHVTHVKWVEAGTPVSYGGTFTAARPTRVATIPVGYGDGYSRSLSNQGYVLIHGKKAPIIGRVCMDQFMVDVTDIEDVQFGDKAVLIGEDGGERITVDELSSLSDRFNYEFICSFGKRVPREYLRFGEVVEQMDYFA